MDLKNIVSEIEKVDPEFYERTSPRRHMLKSFGSKVAVAALPFALGSMFKKAYGKTTDDIVGVLNFALTLEYLEYNFYQAGLNATGLIPATDTPALSKIAGHEKAHVAFLATAIKSMGGTPIQPFGYTGHPESGDSPYTPTSYDLTDGGTFPTVLSDYSVYITLAQVFEDTGVRAYKGQAGALQSNDGVLIDALQIHSMEARHAAHIRYLRRRAVVADTPKPWITTATPPISKASGNYAGEDNLSQSGVTITTLNNSATGVKISESAASEAFDEPLDMATVNNLVKGFLKTM